MAEGNPRETLLKYDDPVDSPMGDDQLSGQKGVSQKGFSSNWRQI